MTSSSIFFGLQMKRLEERARAAEQHLEEERQKRYEEWLEGQRRKWDRDPTNPHLQ